MKAIKAFSQFEIRPLLGAGFSAYVYAKRDLVRMRVLFGQAVLFAQKRSDWLLVTPTFYVASADPAGPVLTQTMLVPISERTKIVAAVSRPGHYSTLSWRKASSRSWSGSRRCRS